MTSDEPATAPCIKVSRSSPSSCCWWPAGWWWCSASSGSPPSNTYHATFTEASRLKSGQDVRIAGVPVGSVKGVKLNPDNTVDVAFDVNKRYQLYTSTGRVVRYENLVGDRYLEIASGPGDLRKLPAGGTIVQGEHPARAGPRRAARWPAPGAQGPRRREGQRGQQRGHRTAAGPGRRAVEPAVQHQLLHPGPRRPRPADRRRDQQPQHRAGHRRREGRAVQRQRRPAAEADHRAGRGPRSDRRRDPAAGVGRRAI